MSLRSKVILDPTGFHCMDKNILHNIFFCLPQKNENHTVMERHERESNFKIKVFFIASMVP